MRNSTVQKIYDHVHDNLEIYSLGLFYFVINQVIGRSYLSLIATLVFTYFYTTVEKKW